MSSGAASVFRLLAAWDWFTIARRLCLVPFLSSVVTPFGQYNTQPRVSAGQEPHAPLVFWVRRGYTADLDTTCWSRIGAGTDETHRSPYGQPPSRRRAWRRRLLGHHPPQPWRLSSHPLQPGRRGPLKGRDLALSQSLRSAAVCTCPRVCRGRPGGLRLAGGLRLGVSLPREKRHSDASPRPSSSSRLVCCPLIFVI